MHVQCFLHLNNFRHWFQDKMKQSLAWSIILIIHLQAVRRAQPDSFYWLYVCMESPAWAAQAQTPVVEVDCLEPDGCWALSLCPSASTGASEMPQHLQPRGKGCRPPGQRSHPYHPLSLAWGTEVMWGASLSGIAKNWAAKAGVCVWFGLCVLGSSHGVSHPLLLRMGLGRNLPSCQVCFLCPLVFLISSYLIWSYLFYPVETNRKWSYI